MRRQRLHILLALSAVLTVSSPEPVGAGQSPTAQTTPARKEARAARVAADAIRLDGHLDEASWQSIEPVTDLLQAEPVEGAAPTDRTEVRFAYDESSLWIGARMFSTQAVQAPMSRRDDGQQAEYLQIELDTYLDRRTAYMFGVTASGVRIDHFHPTDNEDDADGEFDPVWEARTVVTNDGWMAELRIPFSQLRFNDQPSRVWGLNIKRWRPDLNEEDYWVIVGRTQSGWASRFGDLHGIDDVRPRTRLELLPYIAGSSNIPANRDPNDPFNDGINLTGRVGADIKVGLGSSLTLEATINPDFGQIEADPAEVNLSVFETTFSERRPFFIEGNNVLEAGTGNYYYSRRIGARPAGVASGTYVDYPDTATILGAAKMTGRLRSGTSIGVLGAVTAEEFARTSTGGVESTVAVAPSSTWAVGRVIQELSDQGSTVGAHVTLVHRNLDPAAPLAATQNRNAITTGVDTRLRFKDRTYEAAFNLGLTFLDGEPAAIARVQRASGHYFQRLDQPTIRFDPTRRRLSGAQIQGSFNKIAGRHWLWGYQLMIETPEFDPLDFGRLNYAGDFSGGPRVTYRETRPGRYLRAYSLGVNVSPYWYFDTNLGVRHSVSSNNSVTFRNFWVGSLNVTRYTSGLDTQLTRGGPSMGTPSGLNVSTSLRNSTGATTRWSGDSSFRSNALGDGTSSISGSVSARPSPSIEFSFAPEYSAETGTNGAFMGAINRQYLTQMAGGRPETYDRRYIFGVVDRTTISAQFRFSYVFKPDVTLDVYAEPFAASGTYSAYGELAQSGGQDLRLYGTDGTTITTLADGGHRITDGQATFTLPNYDFNVRSYRSNVVLRWEWRPGSTAYVVWQQNRASSVPEGQHVGVGDLFGSLSAPGDNIFAVKTTFWISR